MVRSERRHLYFIRRQRYIETVMRHTSNAGVVLGVRLPKMSRATAHRCQCCSGCTLVDTMIPVVAVVAVVPVVAVVAVVAVVPVVPVVPLVGVVPVVAVVAVVPGQSYTKYYPNAGMQSCTKSCYEIEYSIRVQ